MDKLLKYEQNKLDKYSLGYAKEGDSLSDKGSSTSESTKQIQKGNYTSSERTSKVGYELTTSESEATLTSITQSNSNEESKEVVLKENEKVEVETITQKVVKNSKGYTEYVDDHTEIFYLKCFKKFIF